jgi:endonuclease/exonuclease/phosphatase family metal-dependent hydrolase
MKSDYQIAAMPPVCCPHRRTLERLPMLNSIRFCGWLAFLLVAVPAAWPAGFRSAETLCVMTFNLRFASTNTPNAWVQRRPVMQAMLHKVSPDVIGTQEGLYEQLKDLEMDLPRYAWIGLGREGGSRGEFGAVFYRKNRLEPLEFDHFWLSDTPDVIASTTWGNKNRRMVTWVRFRDRATRREFYLFNTHFDHEQELARTKSAELVRERVAGITNGRRCW